MKIGIAGTGGIGSNVAMHLVRSGITNLKFGDFDRIEKSNLNRQFYFEEQIGKYKSETLKENLTKISQGNYEVKVIKFEKENMREFFKDCDIVVDGFDKKEYKALLLEEVFDGKKLLITVSGIGGIDSSSVQIVKRMKNLYIVGDMKSDVSEYKTYSHKVNIVASKVVEVILKELYNEK